MSSKIVFLFSVISAIVFAACGPVNVRPPGGTDPSTDSGGEPGPKEFIDLECETKCQAIADGETYGTTAEQMACAMDICGDDVLLDAKVGSLLQLRGEPPLDPRTTGTPWEECVIENMARSYRHFGDPDNSLAPHLGDSYAFLATAPVTHGDWDYRDDNHSWSRCDDKTEYIVDSWANSELLGANALMADPIELTLTLQAPEEAEAFRVHYVFMSTSFDSGLKDMHRFVSEGQYDISMYYDDKFYILKNTVGGSIGTRRLINYTDCRWPEFYWMRECTSSDLGCDAGEKVCPVSVLSGMSQCCWFECDRTGDELDLAGTGFECAIDSSSDNFNNKGSSTGWLETVWPVEPGEKFEITFHIHDAGKGGNPGGSAVLIDSFQFVRNFDPGTIVVE